MKSILKVLIRYVLLVVGFSAFAFVAPILVFPVAIVLMILVGIFDKNGVLHG